MTFPVYLPPNRVVLRSKGFQQEYPAVGVIPVGSLMQDDGSGNVEVHGVLGGRAEKMFALERTLQGLSYPVPVGAFDSYQVGDQVTTIHALPGDVLLGILQAGQNVTIGEFLCSGGDGTLVGLPSVAASQQLYESTADSASVTNTTAATAFNVSYTIPANTLQVGDVIHVRGVVSVPNQNSTDTLTLKLLIGATVVIATAAVDVATNDEGTIDAYLVVRSIGSSGTFVADGSYTLGTPGTATVSGFYKSTTSFDTTVGEALTMSATWSAASANDQAVLSQFKVELMRTGPGYFPISTARDAVNATAGGPNGAVNTYLRHRIA